MAKRKAYIQLRQGWFRQIGLAPKKGSSEKKLELPCGDCLDFFVTPSWGGTIRCTGWISVYGRDPNPASDYEPRVLSGSDCDPDSGPEWTVEVGKSPTGDLKVWYKRKHYISTVLDNCDWTTTRTDSSFEETIDYSIGTQIGCSNERGGSYQYTMPTPTVAVPSRPPNCGTGLYNEFRFNRSYHWISDDFLGYSYFNDGHWTDNGYPTPP